MDAKTPTLAARMLAGLIEFVEGLLGGLFYWLDLNDAANDPDHGKVIGFLMGSWMVGLVTFRVVVKGADPAWWEYLITVTAGYGWPAWRALLKSGIFGLRTQQTESRTVSISEEIQTRRTLGGGDGVEVTE